MREIPAVFSCLTGRRAAGLLVAFALLCARVASARERIVLVPFAAAQGASAEDAARFTRLVQAQLDLEGLLWTPAAEAPKHSPVHADFAQARKLYRARRFPQAKALLDRAFSALEKDADAFDAEEVAGGYVLLGAIELRGGSERRCVQALEKAVRVDPAYRPARGEYPPIFLRELDRARSELARAPRFALTVDGPDGADVFLDGKRAGILPGVHVRTTAGMHHLRLKGAQGEDFSEWIAVKGTTEIPVAFPPAPERQPIPALSGPVLSAEVADSLGRALAARKAELAAVGVVTRSPVGLEAHAALFQRRGGAFFPVEPVHFDPSFRAAEGEALVLAERLSEAADSRKAPALLPYDLAPPPVRTAPSGPVASAVPVPQRSDLTPREAPPAVAERAPIAEPAPIAEDGESRSFLSSVPTWVWIVGGVGLAAGAGATYYAIHQSQQPVTGTVEATW